MHGSRWRWAVGLSLPGDLGEVALSCQGMRRQTFTQQVPSVSSHLPWLYVSWCLSEHMSTGACVCMCRVSARAVCLCICTHVLPLCVHACACLSVDVIGTLPSQRYAKRRHCQPGCGLPTVA